METEIIKVIVFWFPATIPLSAFGFQRGIALL